MSTSDTKRRKKTNCTHRVVVIGQIKALVHSIAAKLYGNDVRGLVGRETQIFSLASNNIVRPAILYWLKIQLELGNAVSETALNIALVLLKQRLAVSQGYLTMPQTRLVFDLVTRQVDFERLVRETGITPHDAYRIGVTSHEILEKFMRIETAGNMPCLAEIAENSRHTLMARLGFLDMARQNTRPGGLDCQSSRHIVACDWSGTSRRVCEMGSIHAHWHASSPKDTDWFIKTFVNVGASGPTIASRMFAVITKNTNSVAIFYPKKCDTPIGTLFTAHMDKFGRSRKINFVMCDNQLGTFSQLASHAIILANTPLAPYSIGEILVWHVMPAWMQKALQPDVMNQAIGSLADIVSQIRILRTQRLAV